MRKGLAFCPSKRVIWRNRHRLVFGARYKNKNSSCQEYQFYSMQEKEYVCPEPPEEDDDPEDGSVCEGESQIYTGGLSRVSYQRCSTIRSVREPIEDNEAPQWLKMGPEFKSDNSGDGRDSSEEHDPEEDKAVKRKGNQAKAPQRLRTKRKRKDPEDRSSEYAKRTKRRRDGIEKRTRYLKLYS